MNYCPNCGESVSGNAKFCRKCGKPLSGSGTPGDWSFRPLSSTMSAPESTGEAELGSWKPNPQPAAQTRQAPESGPEKRRKQKKRGCLPKILIPALIAIGGTLLIALLGGQNG